MRRCDTCHVRLSPSSLFFPFMRKALANEAMDSGRSWTTVEKDDDSDNDSSPNDNIPAECASTEDKAGDLRYV